MKEQQELALKLLQEQYWLMEKKLNQYQLITSVLIEQIESKRLSIKSFMLYSSLKDSEYALPFEGQESWNRLHLWTDIPQLQFYSRLKAQYPYLQPHEHKLNCLIRL